ncbi:MULTISPECIES: prolyl oligopeptidase family serine peptidase [Flavobacteriaceae]|uniref:prolyl oligopeptidase family serine peptidase n=1 Tax=Flavobacteriaceae TaxID=49546 RepID=UPI00149113E9|nr:MULTISPECIES: prolyl oligopeptidase family serine peptidase [Allomuricauda]MDC6365872.1 prolyl oligopeptidase family serine peptidase [Muricauda sp. AC10]
MFFILINSFAAFGQGILKEYKQAIAIDSLFKDKFIYDTVKLSYRPASNVLKIVEKIETKKRRDWGYWGNIFDETTNPPVVSPDSLSTAYIKNTNIYIKNNSTQEESQLCYAGFPGFFYSSYLKWSPDGEKIIAYKVRPSDNRKIYFVESSPSEQFQPTLRFRDYLKPVNLMLILGEVDENVDPASTLQFANALIKADKNFELVTIPGMGHSSGGEYGERKCKDFL